jgi:uncharacterized iron-regulated protein
MLMKTPPKALATAIAFLFFCTPPASAQSVSAQSACTEILTQLAPAQVVYLGETHDNAADHQGQLAIIQALYAKNPQMAIALEMFQRPAQPLLDQYLAGTLTEAQLQQQSEYDQRWGFPWDYYAPILRFAKTHQIPLIALNVPTEITRKVARTGLESLTPSDRQWIPPDREIRTDNAAYREMIQAVYDEIHQGRSVSSSFDRFFLAQVLWDETMAQGVADFLQAQPDRQIIVLAGDGHIVYDYGIPSRVERRIESVVQRSVIINPDEGMESAADYLWWSDRCPS